MFDIQDGVPAVIATAFGVPLIKKIARRWHVRVIGNAFFGCIKLYCGIEVRRPFKRQVFQLLESATSLPFHQMKDIITKIILTEVWCAGPTCTQRVGDPTEKGCSPILAQIDALTTLIVSRTSLNRNPSNIVFEDQSSEDRG